MQRRLKDAVKALTAETISAGRRVFWQNWLLLIMTAVLVALTFVLAFRR